MGLAKGKANRVEDPMSKKVNFSGLYLTKAQSLCKGLLLLFPLPLSLSLTNITVMIMSLPFFLFIPSPLQLLPGGKF